MYHLTNDDGSFNYTDSRTKNHLHFRAKLTNVKDMRVKIHSCFIVDGVSQKTLLIRSFLHV